MFFPVHGDPAVLDDTHILQFGSYNDGWFHLRDNDHWGCVMQLPKVQYIASLFACTNNSREARTVRLDRNKKLARMKIGVLHF
jgi:hypothetical protein